MSRRPVSTLRMRAMRAIALPFAIGACLVLTVAHAAPQGVTTYPGPCDASAAVALDAEHFIVANDESNLLLTYRAGATTQVGGEDVGTFLGAAGKNEADIEGAARIGSRVYWIASHSRNSRGEEQLTRHRLFATDIVAGAVPRVVPVGMPYRDLLQDLVAAPSLSSWSLGEGALRAAEAAGGLNIEGLAATPQGGLLVGFRNPLRAGRALVVPIDNPADVVLGRRASLGEPMALDLGGRGIRSFDRVGSVYYILAGPVADAGTFAVFRWSGSASDAPVQVPVDLGSLRPEALFALPGASDVVLVSDDGGIMVDGRECKKLSRSKQRFRTMTLTP